MKAYKLLSKGTAAVVETPKPALRPEYLLIRVICIALNPTDWKNIQNTDVDSVHPLTVGCDFSGIVEEVGSAVTQPFSPGDRVCGFAHSCHTSQPEDGAFAEYIVAKADVTLKLPGQLGFEEAASLGLQIYTVGQGLYQSLQLPWPTEPVKVEGKFPILIYGGSTAMGTLGIQMAKLSGLEVITTCSPSNFELVTGFGADKVFDYNSPTVGADIRQYTKNKLRYVWDTIGDGSAPKICADALSSTSESLYYSALTMTGVPFPREDVKTDVTIAYTIFGAAFDFFGIYGMEAMPQNREFAKKWGVVAAGLFAEGKCRTHPVEVRNGLEGIGEGLKDLEEGKVRGKKLVYRVSEQ